MDPLLAQRLRAHWPALLAAAVLAVFIAAQAGVHAPLQARFDRALARAGSLGSVLDPARGAVPAAMPPRVYTLLMENSAPGDDVDARAQAGTLGAELVQQLSSLATLQRLDVVVAEPGALTQQPGWSEVRAHLRMRGSWAHWLAFLDAVAHSGRLLTIERFSVSPADAGALDIEVWIAGATLKRRRAAP